MQTAIEENLAEQVLVEKAPDGQRNATTLTHELGVQAEGSVEPACTSSPKGLQPEVPAEERQRRSKSFKQGDQEMLGVTCANQAY